jgi:hypothetical protein
VATVRGLVGVDIEQSPDHRVGVSLPGNMTGTLRWPLAGHRLGDFTIHGPDGPPVAGRIEGDRLVVPLRPGRTTVTAAESADRTGEDRSPAGSSPGV